MAIPAVAIADSRDDSFAADAMKLGYAALAAGHELTWLDTVGSTNAHALDQPLLSGAHWFVAGQQTAGRGRQGRHWSSPPGNLYASLRLVDPCEPRHAAKLGFVAGVSLVKAIHLAAPQLKGSVRLKWPNDVLLDGAKLAGILLEAQTGAHLSVAIGMGLNLAFHPEDTPYPATSLAAKGCPLSVVDILPALSDSVAQHLKVFARGEGFAAIRQDWLRLAHGLHGPISVRLPRQTAEGRFDGIDAEGRLMLEATDRGMTLIDAGDVYFGGNSALGAVD